MANQGTDPKAIEQPLDELLGGAWKVWYGRDNLDRAAVAARYGMSASGRWVVTGVMVLGDVITADMLRAVSVSSLENAMNLAKDGSARLDAIRAMPPLKRTPGMSSEEFSHLFAEHYKAWAAIVQNPIAHLAHEHDIKVTTLRTWLREARLRGLLPPGKRGKSA